mgnify:CR=1 FL=1
MGVRRVDERKRRVLQAIIDDYITGAEPVGSRTLARKYQFGVSSATIRNEMADLEELGYLEQPHTSAGRIPSSKGYRYYVDYLMNQTTLSVEEVDRIGKILRQKAQEIHSVIHQTVRILVEATDCLAMVTTPEFSRSTLRHIQVMPLREDKALLLMISDNGFTESKMIELPRTVTLPELQHISRILTEHLAGQTVASLRRGVMRDLLIELNHYQDIVEHILEHSESDESEPVDRLFMGGTTNMLRQPEFRDIEKIGDLLMTLEHQNTIYKLLKKEHSAKQQGIRVVIGEEIEVQTIQECSLVATSYKLGGKTIGHIGVLGPRRMPYARVIALVDAVAVSLNELLEKHF